MEGDWHWMRFTHMESAGAEAIQEKVRNATRMLVKSLTLKGAGRLEQADKE